MRAHQYTPPLSCNFTQGHRRARGAAQPPGCPTSPRKQEAGPGRAGRAPRLDDEPRIHVRVPGGPVAAQHLVDLDQVLIDRRRSLIADRPEAEHPALEQHLRGQARWPRRLDLVIGCLALGVVQCKAESPQGHLGTKKYSYTKRA